MGGVGASFVLCAAADFNKSKKQAVISICFNFQKIF